MTYERRHQKTVRQNAYNLLIHLHDKYEIYINLGDMVRYVAGEHLIELSYGSLVCISPSTEHYAYNDYGNIYHRARLHLSADMINNLTFYQPSLRECFESPVFVVRMRGPIMEWVDSFERAADMCTEDAYLPVIPSIIELFLRLQQSFSEAKSRSESYIRVPKILNDILKYINQEDNYLTISSNRELARHFYITESYLSRLFCRYMPMTAHQYLLKLKMEYAKKMLSEGASVTETCFSVGFSDCSHFIAVYKKYMGKTPGNVGSKVQ